MAKKSLLSSSSAVELESDRYESDDWLFGALFLKFMGLKPEASKKKCLRQISKIPHSTKN